MTDGNGRLGVFPFVLGGMSFMPLIGLPFGFIAILWGVFTRKAGGGKLAIVGACGIATTIVLYSSLFFFGFVQRGGIYDDLRVKLSETTLTSTVQAIEFYRVQHGQYPVSLEVLQQSLPPGSMVFVIDPTNVDAGRSRYYHYELIDGEHYYLLGVGPDGQPFTDDDVLPDIELIPGSAAGLLVKRH